MASHSVTCLLTPASQAGTRFTNPGGMEGCVDLGSLKWLDRESNWWQYFVRNTCYIEVRNNRFGIFGFRCGFCLFRLVISESVNLCLTIVFGLTDPSFGVTPGLAGPQKQTLGIVVVELLHAACSSCHPTNSIKQRSSFIILTTLNHVKPIKQKTLRINTIWR